MYRVVSLIVAGVAFVAALVVYAQPPANPGDDPPMLKKKGAPDVDDTGLKPPADGGDKVKDPDKKPDGPKADGDKPAEQGKPRPDPEEVLKDVAKSMRDSEAHLAKKEVGDSTRQAQQDALKGLDSLIDLAENPPDDQNNKDDKQANQGDKPDNKDNKQGNKGDKPDNKDNKQGNQGSQGDKPDASRSPGSKTGPSSTAHRPGQGRQRRKGQGKGGIEPAAGNQTGGEKPTGKPGDPQPKDPSSSKSPMGGGQDARSGPPDPRDPNADLFKDPWGHLPETMRAKMNAYPNTKDFMPEYEALISKYYSTIAEQGRRKGD